MACNHEKWIWRFDKDHGGGRRICTECLNDLDLEELSVCRTQLSDANKWIRVLYARNQGTEERNQVLIQLLKTIRSTVQDIDPRMRYVEAQIDRITLAEIDAELDTPPILDDPESIAGNCNGEEEDEDLLR